MKMEMKRWAWRKVLLFSIGGKYFRFSLRNLDWVFIFIFKNINGILILGIMGFHNIHDFEFLDFLVPSGLKKNRTETDKIRI